MKRITAFLLMAVIMISASVSVSALPVFEGEEDGSTTEIYDGVYFTKANLASGSKFGLQKMNIVEFDLADQTLDLEILKREYIASKYSLTTYATYYEAYNPGSEVIAAVNGDLWMTGVHSNTNVTKQILTIPRGVLVSDGVIYCSSQIENETTYTTNGEGFGYFWAFGITNDYVPMIGQPVVSLDVSNTTKSTTTNTLALNRLPAHDTLVVYTGDCQYNYALDDAYEVVLSDIEGEFRFNGKVRGTVSAIYPSDSETKATLSKDTVVLTARGSAVDNVIGYEIGDSVEIDVSVSDVSGRDNDWADAKLVIGGHSPTVLDGVSTNVNDNSNYPATIVGYKNDGSMFFLQNDGRNALWSVGLKISAQDEVLLSMGVNSCLNLDGGGSSTMVIDGNLVNRPSDGSQRAVINGLALVTTEDRAPQAEFEVPQPYRYNANYVKFDTEAAVDHLATGYKNFTQLSCNGNARLTVSENTNDPYVYYNLSGGVDTITANEYKYIIMKYKTSETITTARAEYFLCAGSTTDATGGKSIKFDLGTAGQWNTHIMDLSGVDYWIGNIHGIRIDYFAGNATAGEYMDIEYIALAKTLEEAEGYANGTLAAPELEPLDTSIKTASTSDYTISDGNVFGIKGGSTAYDVVKELESAVMIQVLDNDGLAVRNSSIATGYTVCSYDPTLNKCDELSLVVEGDVNCDGSVDSLDAAIVLRYDAAVINLEGLELLAGDVNYDGLTDNLDAVRILRFDAGLIE